jgi:hypothetical protein
MKIALAIGIVSVFAFVVLMIVAPRDPIRDLPLAQRIAAACKREYPYREDLQNACIIAAANKLVGEADEAKMNRVMREAR